MTLVRASKSKLSLLHFKQHNTQPATVTPYLQPPLVVPRSLADRNELLFRPSNPHNPPTPPRIRLLCFASRVAVLQSIRVPQKSPGWISTPESREYSPEQVAAHTARCSSLCFVHHRRCAVITALSVYTTTTSTQLTRPQSPVQRLSVVLQKQRADRRGQD
jgi:hypothetical protein